MKAYWVIGIVMAKGLWGRAEGCGVDVCVIPVLMPGGMLLDARLRATQMFREIGVNLRIRMGRPAHDPGDTCGDPIVVEFEDAIGYRGHAGALAYARPYEESGACIHVFLDRVLQLGREPAFSNALRAHVMVHEITHVLEGIDRHSAEGVP
jgi:hypothetical protein